VILIGFSGAARDRTSASALPDTSGLSKRERHRLAVFRCGVTPHLEAGRSINLTPRPLALTEAEELVSVLQYLVRTAEQQ
jgi:hypothetical protein